MSKLEVLYTDGETTPEQVMLDVSNDLKDGGITDLAIIYKDKNGYYQSCVTNIAPRDNGQDL